MTIINWAFGFHLNQAKIFLTAICILSDLGYESNLNRPKLCSVLQIHEDVMNKKPDSHIYLAAFKHFWMSVKNCVCFNDVHLGIFSLLWPVFSCRGQFYSEDRFVREPGLSLFSLIGPCRVHPVFSARCAADFCLPFSVQLISVRLSSSTGRLKLRSSVAGYLKVWL